MGFSLSNLLNPFKSFDSGDWGMAAVDAVLPGIQGGTWNPVYTSLYNSGNTPSWYDSANGREQSHEWMDDVGDFAQYQLGSWEDQFKRNPAQFLVGAGDPIATKGWNEALGKDWKPLVSAYGGPTQGTLAGADKAGLDTSNIRGVDSTMRTVIPAAASYINPLLGAAVAGAGRWGDSLEAGEGGWQSLGEGLKSAGKSYIGSAMMPDWWKTVGGTSGALGDVANSTTNGALMGAATGGSGTEGAKGGLVSGVIGAGRNQLAGAYDMPDVGTLGGTMRDADGETSYAGEAPSMAQRQANTDVYAARDGGYMPQSMKTAQEAPRAEAASSMLSPVADFISAFTQGRGAGGQGPSYLDMAGNAMGMYNAYNQKKRIKDELSTLKDMYSENSPYAQRLASKMDRQAALSGRRSQTGSRQTQLQALLAEAALRNQPQTAQLLGLQDEQNKRMAANAIQGVSRLGSMFIK
jgi:hypothetical protein